MADQFDQASKLEELERTQAIKKQQRSKEKPLIIKGVRHCLDCEELILPARIRSVNAVRCINCQVHHEALQKHQKHYRG